MMDFLTKNLNLCDPPENARVAHLYFLKKTHKNPMGIGLIVSLCGGPTENISQFVDHSLASTALPSYLKNTSQLIRELGDLSVPNDLILATIDVKSLYICIRQADGIAAYRKFLRVSEWVTQNSWTLTLWLNYWKLS